MNGRRRGGIGRASGGGTGPPTGGGGGGRGPDRGRAGGFFMGNVKVLCKSPQVWSLLFTWQKPQIGPGGWLYGSWEEAAERVLLQCQEAANRANIIAPPS